MLKRHEVGILLKAGHGKTEVARLTGVSLCSVKRIAQEGPVMHVDDAAERAQRQVGRPSTVTNFRKPILEILQHTPEEDTVSRTSRPQTYARQHPESPWVPQAMHLLVRETRYGCTNPETTHRSEKAFRLLHQQYPKSEWAEKTKYHY